jgi:hypothetical protein
MGAKLTGASLFGAKLTGAKLAGADLTDANIRQASLIDAHLDGANLTGAKLWDTQRGGWSIKGVVCRYVFWDRNDEDPTEYGEGGFERIFVEKPRVVLRYPGRMSPVDLAMLPLIVQGLAAEHLGSKLNISSVQDDAGGALVTITVEDVEDRTVEAFAAEVEALRGDLANIRHRLLSEESLRLAFEVKYQAAARDVLPMLLERALPKQEIHVGQLTAPTIIEGTA